ncbi:unnamed protein product [Musa hybrid cultivar]
MSCKYRTILWAGPRKAHAMEPTCVCGSHHQCATNKEAAACNYSSVNSFGSSPAMDGEPKRGADAVEDRWRKGPWTPQEDKLLAEHVNLHGGGRWNSVSKLTGLRRSGKSCRLRWVNYLRPDLKRGKITPEEESIILELHASWGNRWSAIARSLPGRTDNDIKNYWRTHFKKSTSPSKNNVEKKPKAQLLTQQQDEEMRMTMTMNEVERVAVAHDMQQEMAYVYPFTGMLQGGSPDGSISDGSREEEVSWGGLWHLDI